MSRSYAPPVGPFPSYIALANAVVTLGAFTLIAAIVRSFRAAYDRERRIARQDVMTGAANKATFERHAAKLLDAGACVDHTLLLATIDLDNFKTVNDTWGHAAGDAVLRAFAAAAAAVIRRQDCLGRIGGDEFALLVPVDSAEDGRATAAQLHARLSGVLREMPYPITFSMGALVVTPGSGLGFPALMHEADRLMYVVKRAGKGAVCIDTAGALPPAPIAAEIIPHPATRAA
ncbi:GGDEF domain-containing protein [Sphingomonas sp. CROZ-RG-20F-R02-07]|uniref:GGDEF domain-containing protein n=1 Tax=Sphingomonas sp. CROZ-RG-20F-R02-07 TaxID=2914832 RepID=UPI002412D072|nr:GGDEF domain-containing protein [Sphingomonas sp. CROZ-RG-20F-R02-07]